MDLSYESLKQKKANITEKQRREEGSLTGKRVNEDTGRNVVSQMRHVNRKRISDTKQSVVNTSGTNTLKVQKLSQGIDRERQGSSMRNQMQIVDFSSNQTSSYNNQANSSFARSSKQPSISTSIKQNLQKRNDQASQKSNVKQHHQRVANTSDDNEMNYGSTYKIDKAIEDEWDSYKPREPKDVVDAIVKKVKSMLAKEGFDLMAWGSTDGYNQLIAEQGLKDKLQELPKGKLIIAAGNTKSIWPHITSFKNENRSVNPFDDYSRATTAKIFDSLRSDPALKIDRSSIMARYTNEFTPDKLLSFTRLIQTLPGGDGELCFYQPLIHLLFHEAYGNWHAWRFALIFEKAEWSGATGPSLSSMLEAEKTKLKKFIKDAEVQHAKQLMDKVTELDKQKEGKDGNQRRVIEEETSVLWLKVRQAFSLGRDAWMYQQDMLRYHYGNVPARYFESRSLSAQTGQIGLTEVQDQSEPVDTEIKTGTCYDQDEFEDDSEMPPKSGLTAPPQASGSSASAQVPFKQISISGQEKASKRQSSITSQDDGYSEEFEEILSDENLNNQNTALISDDQFRQPFQKTASNFGKAEKGALEKKMSQTNKIDNIFEKSPRKSEELQKLEGDPLQNKAQTLKYIPQDPLNEVMRSMNQQNDERSRLLAVTHDDSLLSDKQNSNIGSIEAKNVTGPAGTIIVSSQHVKSQTRQNNHQSQPNAEIYAQQSQQLYDINDYNPEIDGADEAGRSKDWRYMDSNPLKDWTFDLEDGNNLFSIPDKDHPNAFQLSSGMMLGRQFLQRPQLRELMVIDKTTSLMSQQKQRMVKRFWGYKNQSHDIKKQSQQALLRHQFINRRSDHQRVDEEKRKVEQQQVVGSQNSVSQPCKEADLDLQERSGGGQTSSNAQPQLNSPSNQLSPSPGSPSQQTKDPAQMPASSRSINFVSTMRKGNIRFPFGYGKKMSTTGRHQQSIWQQPLDPSRDAMTMQGDPSSQLSSPFGAAGPVAIQQRLNVGSHSQAEIGGARADRTRQQMASNKYLTNQINRSNTSNLTMVPMQAISSNDSKIQVKDFIKSELNKQGKKRQLGPQGMSRSTQRVGGNKVVIQNIADRNAIKKIGLVEHPDDNEESKDSVDLLDPNRQLQKVTSQPKASKFVIYNSKIRSDSNQQSQHDPKQSGRSQDLIPTSHNLAPPDEKKRTILIHKKVDADQSLNIELKNQKGGNFSGGIHNNSTNNSNSINALSYQGPTSRDLHDMMKLRYAGISKDDIIRKSTSEIIQKIKQNMKDQSQTLHSQRMGRLRSHIRKAQKYLRLQEECERAWKKAHESEKDRQNYQALSQQLRAIRKSLDALPSEFGNSFNADESIFSNRLGSQIQGNGQDDSLIVSSPDKNGKNIIIAEQKKPDPLEVYSQALTVKRIDIKPDLLSKQHKHDKSANEKNQASLPDPTQANRLFLDAQRLKKIYKSSSSVQIKQGLSNKFSKIKNKLFLDQTYTNTDESLQIRASVGPGQKSVNDVRWAKGKLPLPQSQPPKSKSNQRDAKRDADALTKSFNVQRVEASDPEYSYGDIEMRRQREKLQTAPANKLPFKQAAIRNTERYVKEKTAIHYGEPGQFLILENPENEELKKVMDEIDKQIALTTAGTSRGKPKKNASEIMSKRKSVSTQKQRQSWLLPLAEKYRSDPKSNNDLERELSHRMPYNQALTAAVSKRFPKKLVVNAADYHQTININRYLDQTMQYWYAPTTASHRLPSFPTKREQQQMGYYQKEDLMDKGIGLPGRSSHDRKHEVGRVYGIIDETGEKKATTRAKKRQEASREGEVLSNNIDKQQFQAKKKSVSPMYANLKITQKLYQGKK